MYVFFCGYVYLQHTILATRTLVVILLSISDNTYIKLMRKRSLGYGSKLLFLALLVAVSVGSVKTVYAQTSSSPNYQMTEGEFNAGSLDSCSGQYCAKASIGDMTAGTSKSANGTATFGSVVEGEPLLEVIVQTGESNLGILTTEKTATKTMTVQVRNYLSGGYVLQVTGDPPKYRNHTLSTPSIPTSANPGTEQFGINAAKNTTPIVGDMPVQTPSDQTSFGLVEESYRTPNLFKYTSGDVVARSNSESGQTSYTISMIVNVSNATPAGHFAGDFAAVVIPVY